MTADGPLQPVTGSYRPRPGNRRTQPGQRQKARQDAELRSCSIVVRSLSDRRQLLEAEMAVVFASHRTGPGGSRPQG